MSVDIWRVRRYLGAAVGVAAVLAAVTTGLAQSSSTGKWWTGYGNGADNSRYFASKQINKSNVDQLQVAWSYPYGETLSAPIVARGVIYGRGRNGSLVAVDAKSGKERWVRENMNGMTSRGMNYWESADGREQRLIFAMNSLLQELDASTGKSVTSFGTDGVVDLRVGIDGRDPATLGNIQSNTPGEVFENLIILGSATGEGYMSPPGDIRAYDVLTGRLVWTFHTVPRPGEFGYDSWPKDAWKYVGGTNNWGVLTLDTARGVAYMVNASGGKWTEPQTAKDLARERSGAQVVKAQCAKCHQDGKGGAPKVGDREAWSKRLSQGVDHAVHSAINGHGGMPPRGDKADLTDGEVRAAILYMLNAKPAAAKK
jgi:glucose dehydrogenase